MQNGSPWTEQKSPPTRDPNGFQWGICSVECSISGQFFANLPSVQLRAGPERPSPPPSASAAEGAALVAGARWCIDRMHSLETSEQAHTQSVVLSVNGSQLSVSGYVPKDGAAAPTQSGRPEQSAHIKLVREPVLAKKRWTTLKLLEKLSRAPSSQNANDEEVERQEAEVEEDEEEEVYAALYGRNKNYLQVSPSAFGSSPLRAWLDAPLARLAHSAPIPPTSMITYHLLFVSFVCC